MQRLLICVVVRRYVFGLPSAKINLYPFFTPKHKFFTSNNAIFNINTHTHFFALFNKKTHFLTIFNYKRASCKQIYNFKF